jgi:glycine/D-amino acid oxidase-like deaminating enzyme
VQADVVIVGSGITGAFAARELVKGGRKVVMLEAREACWGATGRVSLGSFRREAREKLTLG